MTTILTIMGGIAGLASIVKVLVWIFRKTPEQKNEDIDKSEQSKEDDYRKTGIPQ